MPKYALSVKRLAGTFWFSTHEQKIFYQETEIPGFEELWNLVPVTILKNINDVEQQFDPSDERIRKKAGF